MTQKVDILMAQNRNGSHVKTPSMSRKKPQKHCILHIDVPLETTIPTVKDVRSTVGFRRCEAANK